MTGTSGSCERRGCSQEAEVVYGFLADPYVIWLDRLDTGDTPRPHTGAPLQPAGALCLRHADTMRPPIGWSLDDRRVEVPQLFAMAAESHAPAAPRRRRGRTASDETQELGLFASAATDAAADAPAWRPAFDVADDLDGLLDAKSPLLARAFRAAGPPERGSHP